MSRLLRSRSWWLVWGIAAGVSVSLLWPHRPVEAVAVDRDDKMVLTTVPIDADTEAVFTLDMLTLDLKGAVISSQKQNKFTAFYHTNLLQDFNIEASKKPQFVLSPGITNLQGGGRERPARGVIYVAETTTGVVHAYGIPWNAQKFSTPSANKLIAVDKWETRNAAALGAAGKTK